MHNASAWIEATLDSVLHQTYPLRNLEVIVVDDASGDDSVAIANAFMQAHHLAGRVIARDRNAGVSAARNLGWRAASGDWVQFLDSDDLLAPQKLEVQMAAVRNLEDDAVVVYSSWQRLRFELGCWGPSGPAIESSVDDHTVARILDDFDFGYVGPALMRRSVLEAVGGFDERVTLGEDIDLMLRIAMIGGRFVRVDSDRPLFFYRETPDSLWRRSASRLGPMQMLARIFRRAEEFLRETNPDGLSLVEREALARRYAQCLDTFLEQDDASFRETLGWIRALGVRWAPDTRRSVRLVSQLVGYEQALRARGLYQRILRPAFGR
jgi:glycosyltransferase involved in cell wall biosynthesis